VKGIDRFCCDKKNSELLGRYGCIIPRQKKNIIRKRKPTKTMTKEIFIYILNFSKKKFRGLGPL
jgi:hypothetical protein